MQMLRAAAIAVGLLSPEVNSKPDGCAGDAADCTGDYAADDACVDLKKDRRAAAEAWESPVFDFSFDAIGKLCVAVSATDGPNFHDVAAWTNGYLNNQAFARARFLAKVQL